MMARIPEQYRNQRVGLEGYRVLNLDLDGVCADYRAAIAEYVVRTRGANPYELGTNDDYHFYTAPGWPIANVEDYLAVHRAAEEDHLYATMPVIPGAPQALRDLSDAHVHIRIVTHRLFVNGQHRFVVSDTAQWLDDNKIPYMSLCFTGLKDSIGATIHIDDAPHNIEVLRDAGQHVVVFDQPYNRNLEGPRLLGWGGDAVEKLLQWFDQWPQVSETAGADCP
jgi:5'(3')-deoxyribonucleotidase